MLELSIIIVTYNPGSILLDTLSSIAAGADDLSYEILLVDNLSQDGMAAQAKTQFPEITVVFNTENRGFAGGNNDGLAKARGQYLLLLNPDVIVHPASLKILVEFMRTHPRVGVCGPRTLDHSSKVALTAHDRYSANLILWNHLGLWRLFPHRVSGRYRRMVENADAPFAVSWVQGHCLLMRREVYGQIGGLDEGFFLFAEEPDLCDRAEKAGWQTYFVPNAVVEHREATSTSRYPERKIRNHHISPLYYFRKRGQHGQVRLLKIGFTVSLLLKMGARLIQSVRSPAVRTRIDIYRKILMEVWRY